MMSDEEYGLEAAGETFARAKCFWDIWDRATWTMDTRKVRS